MRTSVFIMVILFYNIFLIDSFYFIVWLYRGLLYKLSLRDMLVKICYKTTQGIKECIPHYMYEIYQKSLTLPILHVLYKVDWFNCFSEELHVSVFKHLSVINSRELLRCFQHKQCYRSTWVFWLTFPIIEKSRIFQMLCKNTKWQWNAWE